MKRTIKTVLAFMLVLAMLLTVVGCAKREAPGADVSANENVPADENVGNPDVADLPYLKVGLALESVSIPHAYSIYQSLNYVCGNFPGGGEAVVEINNATDPDQLLTCFEKLIAAGCNMLVIFPPNDTMLIKMTELCETAGVYWAMPYREILDEEVKEIVYNSPYFCGTAVQNDYAAGYAATEAMGKAGAKKIAIISVDKSSSTAILRESGMADAAEKYGIEVVAEARDLQQATDAAQAVESFIVSNPDLDAVFVAASMGMNILDGTMSSLEQYDPEGKVKIAVIDFLPGLDTCLEKDRIVHAQGGIYVPAMLGGTILCANAVLNGGRLGDQAWDIPITFGTLSTVQEFNDYSKYVEMDLPAFTFEELESLFCTTNPDVTGQDIVDWGKAYNLGKIYEAHADLKAPVVGPQGVEYVGYSKVS